MSYMVWLSIGFYFGVLPTLLYQFLRNNNHKTEQIRQTIRQPKYVVKPYTPPPEYDIKQKQEPVELGNLGGQSISEVKKGNLW